MPTVTHNKQKDVEAVELRPWQEDVMNEILSHDDKRSSEQYISAGEYFTNRELSVRVQFPRSSGHTFFSSYVAAKFPTLLIYGKTPHYKELTDRFDLHPDTQLISQYEIYYSMFKESPIQPSPELIEVQKMFDNKKVIVVDRAQFVSDKVKDFIFATSSCIVVLLG